MRAKHVIILLIVSSVLLSFHMHLRRAVPVAQKGVLDLTNWDMERDGTILLNGEWEVYLNQFVTSEDIEKGAVKPSFYVSLPATTADFAKLALKSKNTYATLRMRIKMDQIHEPIALKSFIVFSAFRVLINDEWKDEVGIVGSSKESSLPYYLNSQVSFHHTGNELEIIYHASDFYLNDLSVRSPILGLETQIKKYSQYGLGKDLFLFGSLFAMGLYHLGLYAKRKKDKAPLYFGLLCLLIAMRTIVTGERYLEQLFFLPFEVYCKIGYISAYMGLPLFLNFLNHTMDHLLNAKLVKVINFVGLSLTVITLLTTRKNYDLFLNFFFVCMGLALLYVFVKLLLAYQKKTPYAGLVLLGFLAIGIAVANDIIYQTVLTSIGSFIPLGVFLFMLSQSELLAFKFSKAFRNAEELTSENESILQELKELNKTLERKVQERTEELNALLSELEQSNHHLMASMKQLAVEVEEHKIAEQKISEAYEKIEIMSKTDYLTKLSNRRDIFDRVKKEAWEGMRHFSVILCDIDHFKRINDTYGHSVGDRILKQVANQLRLAVGPDDHVARWGGEEFLILLNNTKSQRAVEIMERIRQAIENMTLIEGSQAVSITMTFGVCQYDGKGSFDSCIVKADKALYQGKKSGRNQVVLMK